MHGSPAPAEASGAAVLVIHTTDETGALTLRGSFLLKMFRVCITFSIAGCAVGLPAAELCVSGGSPPRLQSNVSTAI